MKKITKKEILQELKIRTGLSQRILNLIFEAILEEIKKSLDLGEEVKISGFGTFKLVKTKNKKARDLKSGNTIVVPPFKKVVFHLSPTLRAELHNEKDK